MTVPPEMTDSGLLNLSRQQTVRRVRRWIQEGTPGAVVRMGEGEGRLLVAEKDDPRSIDIAVRKLRRQTGLTFSHAEMFKVKASVMRALDEADILGLRVSASFSDEHKEWGKRIADVYAERIAQGKRKPACVTHCVVSRTLYEALPKLLAPERPLSVISCRNVKPVLEADYGARGVSVYQVPSQYVVRDVDEEYEAALHDVPIWPDFYRELSERVEVRDEAEIFLIGAGVLGKELCIRVRELGGIALDLGSALDRMAGKTTRGRRRPVFRPFPEKPRVV